MSNQVQRLRFFDGEYLRSYDFTDEQSYHIEIRRRLNHRLHLRGIVYGLQIVQDQNSVPPAIFYSIAPGMALDHTGREIFVPAPYSLSSSGVLNQPGLQALEYGVWICYLETETGLPAAGYRDCNSPDQHTRWQEAFKIELKPLTGTSNASDCGGVCLGTVTLTYNNGWQISAITNHYRTYVGIRAQRVIAADEEADSFKTENQNIDPVTEAVLPGYLDVKPSTLERGNLIVERNLVVGDDFVLDATKNKNLPKTFPATGNVKITSDLFLNGDFYGFLNNDWLKLKDYIQTLMPNFVVGPPMTIPFPLQNTALAATSGTATSGQFPVFPGTPQVLLAINETDWQDPQTLQNWPIGTQITIGVGNPIVNPGPPGFNTLNVDWSVGPGVQLPPTAPKWSLPLLRLVVGFVVIYKP